jgi:hypothetical protein
MRNVARVSLRRLEDDPDGRKKNKKKMMIPVRYRQSEHEEEEDDDGEGRRGTGRAAWQNWKKPRLHAVAGEQGVAV